MRDRRVTTMLLGLVLMALAACAGGMREVGPEDIPELERVVAAEPADLDARAQLGIAYYKAQRYPDARTALSRAVQEGSMSGATFLYLGLTNEALEDWVAAREAYTRYLDVGRSESTKDELRARLALVARNELRQQARLALQQEAQFTDQPPTPRSVAVFPLKLVTPNERLEPLEVALAEMMVTDLSLAPSVVPLERTRVKAMLDEMALSVAGFTDPQTGVRTGLLLRAEHVIQGVITATGDQELRVDASLLNVPRRLSTAQLGGAQQLEAIFDLEKQIVFGALDAMGVQLTAAEREAINENRTQNLLAFLAYGRGLQALDRGDYSEAVGLFNQAIEMDPGFRAAQQQQQDATQLQAAAEVSTAQIAEAAVAETPGGAVAEAPTAAAEPTSLLQQTANEVVPSPATQVIGTGTVTSNSTQSAENRNSSQESGAGGQEGSTRATARITITIPRPGSGQ